jgi:hypothetical protein
VRTRSFKYVDTRIAYTTTQHLSLHYRIHLDTPTHVSPSRTQVHMTTRYTGSSITHTHCTWVMYYYCPVYNATLFHRYVLVEASRTVPKHTCLGGERLAAPHRLSKSDKNQSCQHMCVRNSPPITWSTPHTAQGRRKYAMCRKVKKFV